MTKNDPISEDLYQVALQNLIGSVALFSAIGLKLGKGEEMGDDLKNVLRELTGGL